MDPKEWVAVSINICPWQKPIQLCNKVKMILNIKTAFHVNSVSHPRVVPGGSLFFYKPYITCNIFLHPKQYFSLQTLSILSIHALFFFLYFSCMQKRNNDCLIFCQPQSITNHPLQLEGKFPSPIIFHGIVFTCKGKDLIKAIVIIWMKACFIYLTAAEYCILKQSLYLLLRTTVHGPSFPQLSWGWGLFHLRSS